MLNLLLSMNRFARIGLRYRFFAIPLLLLSMLCEGAEHAIKRGDQELVVETNLLFESKEQAVLSWVGSTADALARVYGRWPRNRWRVEVTPIPLLLKDPVPWAYVKRGNPDTVIFYIDPLASEQELIGNWTAYHEFSHLLIPYRGWGDLWFSEGLASYYQNLIQHRHGVLSEVEMWQKIHAGFVRGRTDNRHSVLSLQQVSEKLRKNGSYMRVYWSGAQYFLKADFELRRRTNNKQSMDTALNALNQCCGEQKLSVREMTYKLDRLTGQELFVPLFFKTRASHTVLDFESLYAKLGVSVNDSKVELMNASEYSCIRRAMAAGNTTSTVKKLIQ